VLTLFCTSLTIHQRYLSACPAPVPGMNYGRDVGYSSETFELFGDYRRKMHNEFPITLDFSLNMLVISFIKYFDDSTSDEDEANVYMERE
jgi:hypothetical protein